MRLTGFFALAILSLGVAAYALAVYGWLPLVVAGVPFAFAYPVVAWLCWLPNLLAAEMVLGKMPARPSAADPLGSSRPC